MILRALVMLSCLFVTALQPAHPAETEHRIIQPPRDFAYTLGDVLVQQIVLPDTHAQPELSVLGSAARVSDWLERQRATLTQVGNERRLQLRYQIVNSPDSITIAELPGLGLKFSDGSTLKIQKWPFTLGPLSTGDGLSVKADDVLPGIDVNSLRTSMTRVAWFLAATLFGWCAWWAWRSRVDRHRLPFARAVHRLKRSSARADPQMLDAWKIVHEAFNATAGKVITRSDVGEVLENQPWMSALENRVDAFFEESSSRFYSQPPRARPFDLPGFARLLAAEEKRNAS